MRLGVTINRAVLRDVMSLLVATKAFAAVFGMVLESIVHPSLVQESRQGRNVGGGGGSWRRGWRRDEGRGTCSRVGGSGGRSRLKGVGDSVGGRQR